MKKYKYYNNTNGVVQSATRNSITNKVEVVVKVSSGQLGISTSEVYPITFMAMDDTLFTGFSESCTYNASTDEYTLFFPGASISEETIAKFMYPSAEWELRVTQTELNELFNEVYQLTGNLVTTPEITGPDAPIVYQGTYANKYSFTANPTLAGNTISSFLVDVSGIGTQVVTAADNAGTYTLKIPTTISAGTKLDMYVTATDKICQNMGLPTSSRVVMQQYGFYPLLTDKPDMPADDRYFTLKEQGTVEWDPKFVVYRRKQVWVMRSDDELRSSKNAQIETNYNNYVAKVFDGYDEYEKSTWPIQRELAHNYVMGKTLPANNLLQKLADKQGISLDEFAMKVNDKAAAFDECVATAIAKRNMLQEAVKARTGQDLIDLDVSFNPVLNTSEPTEEVLPVEEPTPSVEGEVTPEADAPEGE